MKKGSIWNISKYLLCYLFAVAACLVIAAEATAGSLSTPNYRIDYCQAKTAPVTIEQAIQCDYQPNYSPLNSGLAESPRWIRVQIFDQPIDRAAFAIRVGPYFLKKIELFQLTSKGWTSQKAGSRLANDGSHRDIGAHLFIASPTPENHNTYYLKIDASSLTHIVISASSWPSSGIQVSERLLGIGAQVGILFAILVFSIVSFGLNPSAVMARFGVSVANLILCTLAGSGILALYIFKQEPLLNGLIFNWALCLRLGLWVWVSQAFLLPYKTPGWYKPSCWTIYILVVACLLLVGAEKNNISNPLMLIGILIAPVAQIIAITKTPHIEKSFQIVLIAGFCISIVLILLAVIAVLFPLQGYTQTPVYLARITDFVSPLVMLSIIVYQNRLVRKELVEVKSALTETRLRSEFETKLLKERTTLIDMLAHELKNPLASISLAVDTLGQSINTSNPNDRQRLRNINQSILNMDAIIERCSLMNLIDQKTFPLRLEEVNIKGMLSALIENRQGKQAVDFNVDDHLSIRSDPQFLQIILSNLIENGLKYSPAKTTLKVMAEELTGNTEPRICISITNTIHPGLAPDPKSVFERFYRHPLAQKTRGSGLGLYICKELCHVLGGTIEYRYITNEITFLVELPA
ncbi:ATP-binding protein [Polynucleobacter sphagniphilus]|uniref:sensor histidine kinase n=1 Tax=Polynucleobacter sphagniphilus TaxID=1743169 RepID=UPI00096B6964|nr:ATP-binding protein [Polynucleobacter sphagniphilus]OLY97499.1 hypothetical protein BOQ04_02195 [Polynucleobacter sphagniphilus]